MSATAQPQVQGIGLGMNLHLQFTGVNRDMNIPTQSQGVRSRISGPAQFQGINKGAQNQYSQIDMEAYPGHTATGNIPRQSQHAASHRHVQSQNAASHGHAHEPAPLPTTCHLGQIQLSPSSVAAYNEAAANTSTVFTSALFPISPISPLSAMVESPEFPSSPLSEAESEPDSPGLAASASLRKRLATEFDFVDQEGNSSEEMGIKGYKRPRGRPLATDPAAILERESCKGDVWHCDGTCVPEPDVTMFFARYEHLKRHLDASLHANKRVSWLLGT